MPRTPLAVLLCAVVGGSLPAAPVPKPDGKEVDRLLARVRIDNLGAALAQPGIAKEIGLTDEQKKKLDEITDEVAAKLKAKLVVAKGRNNGDVEGTLESLGSLLEFAREADDAGMKALTPEQVRRLKQIQIQKEGPAALLGRHAVRAINPTAEQEEKLVTELAKVKKLPMMEEVIAMASGVLDGQAPQEMAEINRMLNKHAADLDAVNEAMLKVLTKEQRATWALMTGEPLSRLELLKANTGFGDAKLVKAIDDTNKANVPANAPLPPPPAPPPPPPPPVEKK